MPGELEQALRDCLSHQAVDAPTAPDPAGTAVRRGRRVRRWRRAAASACLTVATAVASAGVSQLRTAPARYLGPVQMGDSTPDPGLGIEPSEPTVPPPQLSASAGLDPRPVEDGQAPVDVVVAGQLRTAAGELVDLSSIGTVERAHRAPGGWLVVAAPSSGTFTLWFVAPTGAPQAVLSRVDAVVVAPDGERVAWRDGGEISVAAFVTGRLTGPRQTAAPAQGVPVGFVGAGVLMVRGADGPKPGYDVWWPDRGGYTPVWNDSISAVYGPLPDGRTVVGRVRMAAGQPPCLALLDAARDLAVVITNCAATLAAGVAGTVSPNGRWLVVHGAPGTTPPTVGPVPGSTPGGDVALIVDLDTAFDERPSVTEAGPALGTQAVWTDPQTLVYAGTEAGLRRVHVDRAGTDRDGAVERVNVLGVGPGDRIVLVTAPLG